LSSPFNRTRSCALLALAAACSSGQPDGGDGGGPASLQVVPSSATLFATAAPLLFVAQVTGSSASVSWSLSPSVGSLQDEGDGQASYTAPANVTAPTSVTLTATLDGTQVTGQAAITINPGGTLTVQIQAPPLVTGGVTVTGPAGFSRTLTGSTSLAGIAPGAYTVAALGERAPGPIADVLYTAVVSGSPATVADGQTAAVIVTYAQLGGTGTLWVANASASLISGLRVSDTFGDAGVYKTLPSGVSPAAVALDATGNLWSVDGTARTVSRYMPATLAALGPPDLAFSDADAGYLPGPVSLAFDSQGNLWVANTQNLIVSFAASSLSNPAPTPAVWLSDLGDGANDVADIAFDAAGNLWVAHSRSGNVVQFSGVSALSGKVSPAPAARLTVSDTPRGLAFDGNGDLWLALGSTVAEYVPGDAGMGLLATLQGTDTDGGQWFSHPDALTFDNSGALWLTSDQQLVQYAQPQTYAGVVGPAPVFAVAAPAWTHAGKLAFDPPAANLP
jgi:sugar lactone lactonase YvrE